jgi:enoyl-CoA hydratase
VAAPTRHEGARLADLVVEQDGAVVTVTLNRPGRHNALTPTMADGLRRVLNQVATDESTRVLVLRGAGPSFCSGWDVSSVAPTPPSPVEDVQSVRRHNELFDVLWRSPVPTIAQVHGHCLAAGTDLALACDLLVCADDARIGYPAVRTMGAPGTHMWLYHLGPQWTKRLLLTGDSLTGVRAAQLGLALEAVASDELDVRVGALARRMALIPRDLLISNKDVVNRGLDLMGRDRLQATAADVEVLSRRSPGAGEFWREVTAHGVRRAVAERDAPFAEGDPVT